MIFLFSKQQLRNIIMRLFILHKENTYPYKTRESFHDDMIFSYILLSNSFSEKVHFSLLAKFFTSEAIFFFNNINQTMNTY